METISREIDFVGKVSADSTAYFFVIILNYIFTPIVRIKTFEKIILCPEKMFIYIEFFHATLTKKVLIKLIQYNSGTNTKWLSQRRPASVEVN